MERLRALEWVQFFASIGIDCPDGIPPRVAFAWDDLIRDPTSPRDDRLIAVANGLSPEDWNELIAFIEREPTPHSRDAMGGITFEWSNCLEELCQLYAAGVTLENRYLTPWFGMSKGEILDAIDRGFKHRDAYVGHEYSDVTPDDLARAAASAGIPPGMANRMAPYLSIDGMREWLDTGLSNAEIEEWVIWGFDAEEATQWKAIGVASGHLAEDWIHNQFSVEEASEWLSVGFSSAHDSGQWRNEVIDPVIAGRLRRAGFEAATELTEWRASGLSLEIIARRREAGLRPPQLR